MDTSHLCSFIKKITGLSYPQQLNLCTSYVFVWLISFMLNLYTFLILHVFNYMIMTYFNIQSWDKDHSTQHEMAIPIMYRFIQKYKG